MDFNVTHNKSEEPIKKTDTHFKKSSHTPIVTIKYLIKSKFSTISAKESL
jgi:hypothetical protein